MASKSAIVMAKMQYTVTYSKRKKHLVSHREKEKEEKKQQDQATSMARQA